MMKDDCSLERLSFWSLIFSSTAIFLPCFDLLFYFWN